MSRVGCQFIGFSSVRDLGAAREQAHLPHGCACCRIRRPPPMASARQTSWVIC